MSAAQVDEVEVKEHSILDQASALGGVAVAVPGIATALGVLERWAYLQVMGWSAPAFKIAMLGPAYETPLLGAALLGLCGLAWWVLKRLRHRWVRRLLIIAAAILILLLLGYVTAANSYSSGTVLLTPPDAQQSAAEKGGRTAAYFDAMNENRFVVVGQRDGFMTLASCGEGKTVRQIPTDQIIYLQDVRNVRLTRPAC